MVEPLSKSQYEALLPSPQDQHEALLASLRFSYIGNRLAQIGPAFDGTCSWFLQNPEYLQWLDAQKLDDHQGILWIKGKFGAGKSTLMKFVLTQSELRNKVSFFFNDGGLELEQTSVGMYRSLLFQLLKPRPHLWYAFDNAGLEPWNATRDYIWSVESLKQVFKQVIYGLGQSDQVTCFIDALDECPESEVRDIIEFFEDLGVYTVANRIRFRVLFSSRHYPRISIYKGLSLVLEGQQDHSEDVKRYIDGRLRIKEKDISFLDDIVSTIHEKAAGCFLFAVLVVDMINTSHDKGLPKSYIRKQLEELPSDLHHLQDILVRDGATQSNTVIEDLDEREGEMAKPAGEVEFILRSRVEIIADTKEDSGYGSLGTKSLAPGKLEGVSAIQEAPEPVVESCNGYQETCTVYSGASGLPQHSDALKYISAFADELAGSFPPKFDISDSDFHYLLKAFAVRLGHQSFGSGGTLPVRELMYLIYRFRRDIIKQLGHTLHAGDHDETESSVGTNGGGLPSDDSHPVMDLSEKMAMWNPDTNIPAEERSVHSSDYPDELDVDDNLLDWDPNLATYRAELVDAPAYQWLQSTIRARTFLQVPGPDTAAYHDIRDQIVEGVGRPRGFSPNWTQEVHMKFTVDWNPYLFAHEQEYNASISGVLGRAITLTGQGNNLQATTSECYMKQTWPETGLQILAFILRAAEDKDRACNEILRDGTHLTAQFVNCSLQLDVVGNKYSVAEVAEQIAWMGAALRSVPDGEDAAYSTAHIAELTTDSMGPTNRTRISGQCRIGFALEALGDAHLAGAGRCWRGMFRNPVIVRGYPIPCRADLDTGLEVSLDMVASLTNCQRVVNFAGVTFIKGFAAMLTAVKVVGDVVLWHLMYNPSGTYISYEDSRVPWDSNPHKVSVEVLEKSRHIVGWTDHVRNYAGAPDADYEIGLTELPNPNSSCVLDRVTVSGSGIPFVTPGASLLVGVKDKPLHLGFGGGDDYMGTLMTIRKRHFVFYDTEEKRGWLVDGASAVLHLLRAYLKSSLDDPVIGEYFIYSDGHINEVPESVAYTGARASFKVLANIDNQNLPLYPKTSVESEDRTTQLGVNHNADVTTIKVSSTKFTLRERVEQLCHVLLQITAYHDDLHSQTGYGIRMRASPRHQIEGFEFMDVATRNDTLWPKVATIQAMSVGWIDFVRSLRAVTLFGVGFGDLLRPVNKRSGSITNQPRLACCGPASSVPIGKDFLAAYGADLDEILKRGSRRKILWRLVGNVYWHSPDGVAFESCGCARPETAERVTEPLNEEGSGLRGFLGKFGSSNNDTNAGKGSIPADKIQVQVLLPATFPRLYGGGLRSPATLVTQGAVVFGHCWKFPLRWSLTSSAPPTEGKPELPSVGALTGSMYDSGIGTSIGSQTSNDSTRPNPPSSSIYSLGENMRFVYNDGNGGG